MNVMSQKSMDSLIIKGRGLHMHENYIIANGEVVK
jgi:hypothetical protein